MILKETMRVVLTAMKMLLDRRELCVTSLEWRIKMCADTAEHGKSAGARTRAQGEITKLRKELENGNKLAQEVRDAINEQRIYTFLAGPSAREIDAIVDKRRLNQHDAEQTVRAIFGDGR